jgi:hypothetical protein
LVIHDPNQLRLHLFISMVVNNQALEQRNYMPSLLLLARKKYGTF